MATIKDIAARLELSPSTVSIVLKGTAINERSKKKPSIEFWRRPENWVINQIFRLKF